MESGDAFFASSDADHNRKRKREWQVQQQPPPPQHTALQHVPHHSPWIDLSPQAPLPPGWEQCLDLQSGEMYFVNWATQTRTLNDPRKALIDEQSAANQGTLHHEGFINLMQLKRDENNRPGGALGLDLEMRLPSLGKPPHLNANTAGFPKGGPSPFDGVNHGNDYISNLNSNMAATVCLHCHTFVMVSGSSPHCPNCRSLCTVDLSTTPRNPHT